jgi:penicillin-binding protein 2
VNSIGVYVDGRTETRRPLIRFLAFGLVVVLGLSGLTARLFYLQIARGGQYQTLADGNRQVLQAIPSARGLIYDRNGVELVRNVPSFTVKIRPSDLPQSRRADVVAQLAALLGVDVASINIAIDSNPGSRFDQVRIATDVDPNTASFIAESRLDLPGVEVVVESRREYDTGPLLSQILGYTGPINAERLKNLREDGYLTDDVLGLTGVEAMYERDLRGRYGLEAIERDAQGRRLQVLQTLRDAQPGNSLKLTIDLHQQQLAQKALQWAMKTAGLKRGVVIVMNPQNGEILAMVSLPTYDNNQFAQGISAADYQKLVENPNKPLTNLAISDRFPPGSTYKLVTGTGALADKKVTAHERVMTRGYLEVGGTRFYEWNKRGWGGCDINCGFGHSSDTYFFQLAGRLGIDRLGYWAEQYGFGKPTGIDLPGEVSGIVPTNQWKQEALGAPIYPGEVYQAGIGQGYDVVTPIQLINAYAALANGGTVYRPHVVSEVIGPDGNVVREIGPEVLGEVPAPASVLATMRHAARNVLVIRHTFNLVDMPIVIAGKSGTAEFGLRDAKGRLPFHSWFAAFVPKDPLKHANDPDGFKAVERTDSELVVLAFAFNSGTKGNAATETVKYFLQLHFDIKQDFRKPEFMLRGNFYEQP